MQYLLILWRSFVQATPHQQIIHAVLYLLTKTEYNHSLARVL